MLSVILDSIKLFLTGRLFDNYWHVFRQAFIAMVIGTIVFVAVAHYTQMLLWGAIAGGAVAGFLLPILFKNLKYR